MWPNPLGDLERMYELACCEFLATYPRSKPNFVAAMVVMQVIQLYGRKVSGRHRWEHFRSLADCNARGQHDCSENNPGSPVGQ